MLYRIQLYYILSYYITFSRLLEHALLPGLQEARLDRVLERDEVEGRDLIIMINKIMIMILITNIMRNMNNSSSTTTSTTTTTTNNTYYY